MKVAVSDTYRNFQICPHFDWELIWRDTNAECFC